MNKLHVKEKIKANKAYKQYLVDLYKKKNKYKKFNFYIFDEDYINNYASECYQKGEYNEAKIAWDYCIHKINKKCIFDISYETTYKNYK